ncbi:prephenate dehydrogenase, partial [Aeromicrobium sp.]|uniref:prephenate dehydrogenase n=1 Tax=Aeromicrobium sp. TaxID=1871063 RepID=UPI00198D5380
CGLIGTSVGLALTETGHEVHLQDHFPANVELAVSRGAGSAESVDEPVLVVVAVPPAAVVETVRGALDTYPMAVVTDVASVKASLTAEIESLPDARRFVGGHPMAGRERSGPMAASARLFEGRPWAVVPHASSEQSAVDEVTALVGKVGAVPSMMNAATHDSAVALVSHLPHLASVLVAGLLNEAAPGALELAGPGLRDVTRIAGSETGLWLDILGSNAAEVRRLLELLRGSVDEAIVALKEDPMRLGALLDAGREGTRSIPGKHGEKVADLVTVFVSVPDQPGELSRLMAHTGESGVNIEDIRIDHELGRPVGQVEIAVVTGRADMLVTALTGRGWSAYR